MKNFRKKLYRSLYSQPHNRRYSNPWGNVLIYVVVVMLIFGVIGVIMVSLFTTSTASTVTRNDTRRAIYMAESGMRYAFSELRKTDFDQDFIINKLNTINYQVNNAGSFMINVFSPWFESDGNQSTLSTGGNLSLKVPFGTAPLEYAIPLPPDSIYAVNFEFLGLNPSDTGRSFITGYSIPSDPLLRDTLTLGVEGEFHANSDERIAFAVQPLTDQTVRDGQTLDLPLQARYIFPKYGGAISIKRNDYFYEERQEVPEGAPTKVVLTNLSKRSESVWNLPITAANDWVILSPRNYLVVPTGTSDEVTYGGDYLFGRGIYDASLIRPVSAPPDITAQELASNLSEQETGTDFFHTDTVESTLTIGGGGTGQFGSAFFNANMNIGGEPDYCVAGACNFSLGIRAFFLLNFVRQGDGISFTLTSGPPQNSASSVGGDFQLSELMGYAGDSRLNAAGTSFLASNEDDRGLDPPKIAVEFDTRTNNMVDDPPPDYCADASTANTDSRNDPLTNNKDAVQYVFWGRTNFLNIPCRPRPWVSPPQNTSNPLYDDNRHDADGEVPTEEWRYGIAGLPSVWHPAIGRGGTIYVSDQVSTLYALDQDGTLKWTFNLTDGNDYMPGIDRTGGPNDGTIYSDIYGTSLVAINPDGSQKWRFLISPHSDVDSTPIVGPDGAIYFGTDDLHALIALNPNGTERWRFVTGNEVNNVAALSPDGTTVYFVSNDNNLYALKLAARLADPTGVGGINVAQGEWVFPILTEPNEITSSPTVNPNDGTIYVGSDDGYVYALKPAARLADPTGVGGVNTSMGEWRFRTNGEIESSAALDPKTGTIYIGSDDGNVWAINPNGTEKWRFPTADNDVESSPIIDLDGTIYIGAKDGKVYALNPDGTQKWFFQTGGPVSSSPAIGQDGFIHIGSSDTNFYTISQFADPRNFKDEDKTSGKLLTVEDLSSSSEIVEVNSTNDWLNGEPGIKGPFGVRLEVDRSLTPNADGKFDYELRLWMRQCNNDTLCDNIMGTFFQDTRMAYDYSAVPTTLPMVQRFSLSAEDQAKFNKFFFGFTAAAGSQALEVTISRFQLSFIRPGDPVVTDDSLNWPP